MRPAQVLGLFLGVILCLCLIAVAAPASAANHTPISGYSGNVRVHISTTSGAIYFNASDVSALSAVRGYPSSDWTSQSASELVFQGTQTDVNAALDKLKHTTGAGNVTIVHSPAGVAYYPTNGHFYQYVSGSFTYSQADTAAETGPLPIGDIGFLVTIGTMAEYEFLEDVVAPWCWAQGYISGSDEGSEGTWIYTGGPAGTDGLQFWDGGRTGSAKNGQTQWSSIWGSSGLASGQPDNSGGNEDALRFESCYQVNDIPVTTTIPYYAEYASTGGGRITSTLQTLAASNFYIPVVQFALASSSGAENISTASVSVNLDMSVGSPASVSYTVTGTATGSGTDYTLADGALTIAAGNTSGTINIASIIDDNIYEGNETVVVTLSNPVNATLGSQTSHTYTITENDSQPVISISDAVPVNEGNSPGTVQPRLTVTLSHPSVQSISVRWATGNGTAKNSVAGIDDDFASDTQILTFPALTTSLNIDPLVFGDDSYENDEEFSIILSDPVNAAIADGTGIVTIVNDDPLPSLSVVNNSLNLEGGTASFEVSLSEVAGMDTTFSYATSDGTAIAGSDYTAQSGTGTITDGSRTATFNVPLTANIVDNPDKTFTFTLSAPTNATIAAGNAVATIIDDDGVITVDSPTVSEAGGTVTFTVTLTGPILGNNVTVDYTTANVTAAGGADYTSDSGRLTFTSANSPPFVPAQSQTVTIPISEDTIFEVDETFEIQLSNILAPGATVIFGNSTGTATITDNDGTPTAGFNTAASSGSEGSATAAIQVSLSNASATDTTISYTIAGTATDGGTDYNTLSGSLTIPALSTSANINITGIVDDADYEGDETIILTLSGAVGANLGPAVIHTFTITENDQLISISVTSAGRVSESDDVAEFNISLDFAPNAPLTVAFETVDGTANSPGDYTGGTGTANFAIGETRKIVQISLVDDSESEGDESFILKLRNPSEGVLLTSQVSVTITDNDLSEEVIREARNYASQMADKLAQERGHDFIEASHRLMTASLNNLLIQSRLVNTAASSARADTNAAFSHSDNGPEDERDDPELHFRRALIGGVKTLNVDADDDSYAAQFDYDLNTQLLRGNDNIISKIAYQTSKQKNGPKTHRLMASFALEKQIGSENSAVGRFVHIMDEDADFTNDYQGKKTTKSIGAGMYKVYSPEIDHLNSVYASVGISTTELDLLYNSLKLDSSYLSYQAQTGFSLGRVYKFKRTTQLIEFSVDAYYDYQSGHELGITSGLSKFNRLVDGKQSYEILARFEPKLNLEFGRPEHNDAVLLQIAPLIKCGTGSMDSNCGYGVGSNLSKPFSDRSGHWNFGMRYEHFRDTKLTEYKLNINQGLFDNDNIRLNTQMGATDSKDNPGRPHDYQIGSELSIMF